MLCLFGSIYHKENQYHEKLKQIEKQAIKLKHLEKQVERLQEELSIKDQYIKDLEQILKK